MSLFISVLLVSLLVPLFLYSEQLVALLFERGKFDIDATVIVSKVQIAYLLHIVPFVISIVWVKMLNAIGRNGIVAGIALVNLFVNIVFNFWFMKIWGVQGIAYATAVVYFVSAILCIFFTTIVLNREQIKG